MAIRSDENDNNDSEWKVVHYGVAMGFDDLPLRLQDLLLIHVHYPDARNASWRHLTLNFTPLSTSLSEILVPVRSLLRKKDWLPYDAILPFSVDNRTEYLTLSRLSEGVSPTAYFVGRSSQTSICYWARQTDY